MRSHSPGCSQRRDASRSRRCLCAWSRTITNRVVNADALMGAGLPEWWGARHARRMYNATTSTNASHPDPDPQGRLHGPRQPAATPPRPCSSAGVQRPCQLPPSTRPAADQLRGAGQRACTTTTVVRHLLDTAGLTPSPRQVTAARRRRSSTDQHLAARAAALGFATLRAYLADRAITRRWPTTSIAGELGVHPATVRDRLDQQGLPRQRATRRPHQATARQTECWAAKRQARLAGLGFASVEGYLGCGGSGRAGRFAACSPSYRWVPHG